MSVQAPNHQIGDIDTVICRLEHWNYLLFGPPDNGLQLFGAPFYCSSWGEVEQVIWLSIAGRSDWQQRINELVASTETHLKIWSEWTPGTLFSDASLSSAPFFGHKILTN